MHNPVASCKLCVRSIVVIKQSAIYLVFLL